MTSSLTDIPAHKLPRHIAIIMDGNGRWAQQRNKPRAFGHRQGVVSVKSIVTECSNLRTALGAPDFLTLYSFSLENWKRPQQEVNMLMELYVEFLRLELPTMQENNIRFHQIGRMQGLPQPVIDEVHRVKQLTQHNTGLNLVFAMNYGSRGEITDAMRDIAKAVQAGDISPDQITEETVAEHLYTAGMPDPDLLIRTAGEMRISNYLLWQISYAEIVVSQVLWPEFTADDLQAAIRSFAGRNRRFGALDKAL